MCFSSEDEDEYVDRRLQASMEKSESLKRKCSSAGKSSSKSKKRSEEGCSSAAGSAPIPVAPEVAMKTLDMAGFRRLLSKNKAVLRWSEVEVGVVYELVGSIPGVEGMPPTFRIRRQGLGECKHRVVACTTALRYLEEHGDLDFKENDYYLVNEGLKAATRSYYNVKIACQKK
ncbi:hypothetical protein CAPTEDRAFT_201112 [Capitella teleta]|uniref:Uncharacterized protein n=1 Tax=Capitella teleta TaxID=283909 RepID=R7V1N7_CAPTE|nr:hypothetical protein CAPTEDRAFT_201112 [Capitella teleta]|eukprot:ELU12474.1 hypothetical protein CAPTEDRAFT_201112 [Capitella teleta]